MEITEVRIKLMEDSDDRLQAFCSITFDNCFVVRDLKIIEGSNGAFVAMPSRKLTSHCRSCGAKNHLRAQHCNNCGSRLREDRAGRDAEGRTKLYADIAHPINSECREKIQERVIAAYDAELIQAKEPGYTSRYDDDYDDAGPEDTDHVRRVEGAESLRGPHRREEAPEPSAASTVQPPKSAKDTSSESVESVESAKSSKSDAASDDEEPPSTQFGAGIFE